MSCYLWKGRISARRSLRSYDGGVRIALWLALAVVAATLRTADVAARQEVPRPPALSIVTAPGLEAAAKSLTRFDTAKLITVMQLVGLVDPGPPITVVLSAEDSPVARQTPSWVAGFADGDAGLIVIFPARTPSYPYDSMEALLHHEVAHVLIARAAPGAAIPRWFHEGMAMALERTWGIRDRSELALAVVGGRRPLATLDADFLGSASSAARAYGVAGAFVHDLTTRHGRGFHARVLSSLAAGATFEAAFSGATAMSLAEAERVFWRESWWYRVVPWLTSSFALWTAIVALAVVARRRRAARRRALRQRWDDEQSAERNEEPPPMSMQA
jgi:hypothetical protein